MDNISYYSIMKLLHVVGMSAWFGTALAVSIIWSKQDKLDLKLILDLISKVEMPASFFIPLTGVLMTIDQTFWLSMGWIQLKIMLGLIAVAFSHISRATLIHKKMDNKNNQQKFSFYRNICLLRLLIIIIFVEYKQYG